jgi:hypothetical protein
MAVASIAWRVVLVPCITNEALNSSTGKAVRVLIQTHASHFGFAE